MIGGILSFLLADEQEEPQQVVGQRDGVAEHALLLAITKRASGSLPDYSRKHVLEYHAAMAVKQIDRRNLLITYIITTGHASLRPQ